MTLATPPARSGSGAAVQNTVRQVGAALGVAILSSVVGTVYRGQISGALAGSPLPANIQAQASDSIGATYEVAGHLAAAGVPAAQVARLEHAANDAFMPAFHMAAFVAAAMLIVAVVLFAGWLPVKPETAGWSATPAPGQAAPVVPPPDVAGEPAPAGTGDQRHPWPTNPHPAADPDPDPAPDPANDPAADPAPNPAPNPNPNPAPNPQDHRNM
jgi:hypothetical protein